jgi:hypothetical protein
MDNCLLLAVFLNYRSSSNVWAIFPQGKKLCNFNKIIVWATFWATFSQAHLVTLSVLAATQFTFSSRVARLFVFKPKIQIWVNL